MPVVVGGCRSKVYSPISLHTADGDWSLVVVGDNLTSHMDMGQSAQAGGLWLLRVARYCPELAQSKLARRTHLYSEKIKYVVQHPDILLSISFLMSSIPTLASFPVSLFP